MFDEPKEIFSDSNKELETERKLAVFTAVWFISMGMDEAETIEHFEISPEDWERWKDAEE